MILIQQLKNAKDQINSVETSSFLKELDSKTLKKLQNTLLEMLLDVLDVCKKHEINVFLMGGTALGAIRHQGFIPWDDDVDIGMPREDYERFVSIFENELSEKYILNAPNYSKTALARFPKILKKDSYFDAGGMKDASLCKVFLDIFIADRIPENRIIRILKSVRCNFLEFIAGQVAFSESLNDLTKTLYKSGGKANYYIRRCIGFLFSYRNTTRWYGIIDSAVQYKKQSNLLGLPTGSRHYNGEVFPKEVFLPVILASFEGNEVPMVHDPDKYLNNLYGNYMQIPPPEKRQKHFVRDIRL